MLGINFANYIVVINLQHVTNCEKECSNDKNRY